ncbi:MAG: GNAT family N-acetyltransferase [Kiloniellales bacterium]|nr:GNAT family N-acetyltransferase [Kiloniellales bacterium]
MHIKVERAGSATPDIKALLEELNAALDGPYADDQQHGLSIEELFAPHVRFFVARLDGTAAGCGGVALLKDYAEVKRMYARESARGRGVAEALLARIEAEARDAGLACLRLETGRYQHAAIRFYERTGFRPRREFGPYFDMPARAIALSLFYEKVI